MNQPEQRQELAKPEVQERGIQAEEERPPEVAIEE